MMPSILMKLITRIVIFVLKVFPLRHIQCHFGNVVTRLELIGWLREDGSREPLLVYYCYEPEEDWFGTQYIGEVEITPYSATFKPDVGDTLTRLEFGKCHPEVSFNRDANKWHKIAGLLAAHRSECVDNPATKVEP